MAIEFLNDYNGAYKSASPTCVIVVFFASLLSIAST